MASSTPELEPHHQIEFSVIPRAQKTRYKKSKVENEYTLLSIFIFFFRVFCLLLFGLFFSKGITFWIEFEIPYQLTRAASFSSEMGNFVCLITILYGSFFTFCISSWNDCNAVWVTTRVFPVENMKS